MQHIIAPIVPDAILLDPEFQEGLRHGQRYFDDEFDPAPLTNQQILEAIQSNLAPERMTRAQHVFLAQGWPDISPLYYLGFVIGFINAGLTCAN